MSSKSTALGTPDINRTVVKVNFPWLGIPGSDLAQISQRSYELNNNNVPEKKDTQKEIMTFLQICMTTVINLQKRQTHKHNKMIKHRIRCPVRGLC